MVLLRTESHRMQPDLDRNPPGNGELSLYCAVILKESHSSHFSGSVLTKPAPGRIPILKLQMLHFSP
jgi:hypothetical protein